MTTSFRLASLALCFGLVASPSVADSVPADAAAPPTAKATATPTTTATLDDGRAILHRFIDAIGGASAFKKAESIEIRGIMNIPLQGIAGTLQIVQARPNKLLVVTDLAGIGKISQGFDGTTGWSVDPMMGPRVLAGSELAQLQSQSSDILSYADLDSYFTTAETVGRTSFEGKDAWEVNLVTKDGQKIVAYYDVASHLQIGAKATASSPMGEMTVISAISDYKDFDGMKIPTRTTQKVMGIDTIVTFDSVKFNLPTLPDFGPPAEVRATMPADKATPAAK